MKSLLQLVCVLLASFQFLGSQTPSQASPKPSKHIPVEFFEPIIMPTGISPYFVVAVDLNHDGFLDLATSNTISHDVTVFINNGDGTFKDGISYPTHGFTPYALATGDINGDGYPDLVCGNLFSVNIAIFLNKGDGTFQDAVNVPTGPGPMFTALADFNNDGKLDIATSNIGHDDITILLNQGDLKFKTVGPFKTGGVIPYSIAAGDWDKDGKIDLATGNIYSANISVLRNLGDGQFGPAEIYKTDSLTQILFVADFNHDGYPDLVSGNGGSDNVSVLLNDGHGKFNTAVNYAVKLPQGVTAGDVDNDGSFDIATANQSANTTSVLINNGDGTFIHAMDYPVGGLYPTGVVLADLNNDGKLDLVTANSGSANISIFLNGIHVPKIVEASPTQSAGVPVKEGRLVASPALKFNTELRESTINKQSVQLVGTLSGTHPAELSYNGATRTLKITPLAGAACVQRCRFQPGEEVKIRLSGALLRSAKNIKLASSYSSSFFVEPDIAVNHGKLGAREVKIDEEHSNSDLVAADLDGDGKLDLVASDHNGEGVSIYYGAKSGVSVAPVRLQGAARQPAQVLLEDFDGDGNPDLAVISRIEASVAIFFNEGNRRFSPPVTFTLPAVASGMMSADLRSSGFPDLLLASAQGKKLMLLANYGNRQFKAAKEISLEFSPAAIAGADMDGDGIEDAVVANPDADKITIYRSDGHGQLLKKEEISLKQGSYPISVIVRDVNLDGAPDILTIDKLTDEIAICLNNGDGTFRAPIYEKLRGEPEQLIVTDIDRDGWPDLAVRHSEGFTIFTNHGGTEFSESVFLPVANSSGAALGDFGGTGNLNIVTHSGRGKLTFLSDENVGPVASSSGQGSVEQPQPIASTTQRK